MTYTIEIRTFFVLLYGGSFKQQKPRRAVSDTAVQL